MPASATGTLTLLSCLREYWIPNQQRKREYRVQRNLIR